MKDYEIEKLLDQKVHYRIGDVFYFTEPPSDYSPARNDNPCDQLRWSEWRKENYKFFKERLGEFPSGAYLLDVGAGPGYFRDLTRRFETLAIDFYPYNGVQIVCDFMQPFPLRGECFDIVMLSNVLEHSAEPESLLREAYRVLRPKGMIIATVPFLMQVHQAPYDFYRFTHIGIGYLFGKSGFTEMEIVPLGSPYTVVETMRHKSFMILFRKRYSEKALVQKIYLRTIKAVYLGSRLMLKMCKPLHRRVGSDAYFTEGYGVRGVKG